MAQEHPTAWADRPEQKPFPIKLNGDTTLLNIGNCAIGLFRRRPEMDYIAIKNEDEAWTLVFDKHPLAYWMGSIAIGRDARRTLHLMERGNGLFADRFGWSADTVVEDYPSDSEVTTYLEYLSRGSEDLHADLQDALKDEFEEE